MKKKDRELLAALDARSAELCKAEGGAGLDWVLMEDAARLIRFMSGKHEFDRLLLAGSTNEMEAAADQLDKLKADKARILDRLLFISNVLDHDEDASLQWVYTEIEGLLSGEKA